MRYLPLLGRVLFAAIFLMSAAGHFSSQQIAFAASQGVPMADIAVPLSGIIEGLGALSILLGYRVQWGAALLVLFLLPVTFMLHAFWAVTDPMMQQIQMVMFMKNLSMMGAAILIGVVGTGPLSLDNRTPAFATAS